MKAVVSTPVSTSLSLVAVKRGLMGRSDTWNIALLLVVFASIVAFISPAHNFPITDDWIYARSVTDLVQWHYTPADWSLTISLGHIAWGALFSLLFGQSFTVLTVANLFMSASCLALFYALARHLGVLPNMALLGTALLGFNPIFFHLSYSFHTDITFLACMLGALLCYLRGVRGHGTLWLWLSSVMVALSYLTRQFGILIIVAGLLYFWWSGRWRWRDAIAMSAVPAVVIVLYTLWEKAQPVPLVTFAVQSAAEGFMEDPMSYLLGRSLRLTWTLSTVGLFLLPMVRLPKRPILIMPLILFFGFFLFKSGQQYGTLFPVGVNTVNFTGFEMYGYDAAPIWSQAVWSVLGILSILVLSIYLARCAEEAVEWLRSRAWAKSGRQQPVLMPYVLGLLLAGTVLVVTPSMFDRYWLPVLPMLFLPGLQGDSSSRSHIEVLNGSPGQFSSAWRWLLALPIAIFSLIGQRDYMEHASIRQVATEQLIAQGVAYRQIDAGFEWQGWHLLEEGAYRLREKPLKKYIPFPPSVVLDPVYVISDLPETGYTEVGSIPYRSWLNGGQTRYVLLLKRK